MNLTDLSTVLTKKYNVICLVDLADITQSPSLAYKLFQQNYKSAYESNDRLVLYTSQPIPDELLTHLVRAANLIDITNCFILICSPNNIQEQILSVVLQHSSDQTSLESLVIDVDATKPLDKNFVLPATVCPIPWMHIELGHGGVYRPCCVSQQTLGTTKTKTILETFAGADLESLRSRMIAGEKPAGCNKCWKAESNGLVSNRIYHKNLLQKKFVLNYLDNPKLTSLDLKPGNTCNFKCRICDPTNSSLHAQERAKTKTIKIAPLDNWFNDSVIKQIKDITPTLTNIDIYGGEPFLIKDVNQVLQHAIDTGYAKNIRLHYNSNGSIYPKNLIPLWTHFNHIDIQFSIDAIGARFELERGGNWAEVESNILQIKSLGLPNCQINIMPAIGAMNIFYIDEVVDWATKHDLPVNPLFVHYPPGLALTALTNQAKQQLKSKFQGHSWPVMQSLLKTVESLPNSTGTEFCHITQHYDRLRNESFSDTHQEIARWQGLV